MMDKLLVVMLACRAWAIVNVDHVGLDTHIGGQATSSPYGGVGCGGDPGGEYVFEVVNIGTEARVDEADKSTEDSRGIMASACRRATLLAAA